MKKFLVYFIASLASVPAIAQFSILHDNKGEGSLVFQGNMANVQLNAANGSFTANDLEQTNFYPDEAVARYRKLKWGANLEIKSVDGVTSLIKGNEFNPQISAGVLVGGTPGLTDTENEETGIAPVLYAMFNVEHSRFNMLDSSKGFAFEKTNFVGFSGMAGINCKGKFTRKADIVFGAMIKFAKENNLDDLDKVETQNVQTGTAGGNTVLVGNQKSGFSGTFEESFALRLNIDAYVYPNRFAKLPIGLGGYIRSQFTGYAPQQNAGVGIIFGQNGAPATIAFGLLYEFNDIFDQQGSGTGAFARGGLNIVAGFGFGSTGN